MCLTRWACVACMYMCVQGTHPEGFRSCRKGKQSWQKGLTQPVHQFTTTEPTTAAAHSMVTPPTTQGPRTQLHWLKHPNDDLGKYWKGKNTGNILTQPSPLTGPKILLYGVVMHIMSKHTHTLLNAHSVLLKMCVYIRRHKDSQTVIQGLEVVSQTADG